MNDLIQVWKGSEDIERVAEDGYRVVASPADGWYLDCGSGSFIDGGRSWSQLHKASDMKPLPAVWEPLTTDYRCDPFKTWEAVYSVELFETVSPKHHHLVLGGEVCLWGEQVSLKLLVPVRPLV